MRARTWMPFVTTLAALGCAHAGAGSQQNTFDLASNGGGLTVTCDMNGCSGPEVQLAVRAGELRGRVGQQAVAVQTSPGKIEGSIGQEPVQLTVREENGGLAINGMFAGQLGQLSVNPLEIQGRIGRCSYDLQSEGEGAYSGQRSCGRSPEPTTVHLPLNLKDQPQGQRAALLALLLASR